MRVLAALVIVALLLAIFYAVLRYIFSASAARQARQARQGARWHVAYRGEVGQPVQIWLVCEGEEPTMFRTLDSFGSDTYEQAILDAEVECNNRNGLRARLGA